MRKYCAIFLLALVCRPFGLNGQMLDEGLAYPLYRASMGLSIPAGQEQAPILKNRNLARPLLLSAIIPGAGQLYNRSYFKAGLFIMLEIGSWFMTIDQHNKGNRLEREFEAFADLYWNEDRYWNALSAESGIDRSQMDSLRVWERQNFSHHLPEEKNQTYYENIGKYNQFNIGWDDAQMHRAQDSQHREQYTLMRKDANDAFELSRTFSTAIILNHIISALEAAYTGHRNSQRVRTSLRFRPLRYAGNYYPAIDLRVTW